MRADLIFLAAGAFAAYGQIPAAPALMGYVRSAQEGPMEGVLVSAQRAGSSITITVVSGANGRYGFPRNRLEPVNIRSAFGRRATNWRTPARFSRAGQDGPGRFEAA